MQSVEDILRKLNDTEYNNDTEDRLHMLMAVTQLMVKNNTDEVKKSFLFMSNIIYLICSKNATKIIIEHISKPTNELLNMNFV